MHELLKECSTRLADILRIYREEMSSLRGSRPTPSLVEDIAVECYGQKLPVKQLGSISVIPPREIQITVWDVSVAPSVAKTISDKLRIQVGAEGALIRASLPALSQERREELIRMVKIKAEEARIRSRTLRDDTKKGIHIEEKNGAITEDERFKLSEELQKSMDSFNKDVDALVEKKILEINE